MKKNKGNSAVLLLGLGAAGAVGAFVFSRGGFSLPGLPGMPGATDPTVYEPAAPAAPAPRPWDGTFGVGNSGTFLDRYGSGLTVGSGGGTTTPTMSSDRTPTSGVNADVSIYGPSNAAKWGGY